MLLFLAIGLLGLVTVAGAALAWQYILLERPPSKRWPGLVHGAAGAAGFAVLVVALGRAPPAIHAVKMGVGAFGMFSGALIAGALAAGLTILLTHVRSRPVSTTLVATHGMLAITGYTLLVTYLTMLK